MSDATPPVLRCPRCGAAVPDEQAWCLQCGYGARTRIAPTPRFRRPLTGLLLLAVVAFAVLALAFADLTADHGRIPATITATTPAPAVPGATTAAPGSPSPPVTPTTAAPPVTAPPPLSTP